MHFSVFTFAFVALAGSAMSAPQDDPFECVDGGHFYGEESCMSMCKDGDCALLPSEVDKPDHLCVCEDASGPGGCSEMVKGKEACESICTEGECTLLLLGYECTCPN